MKYPFLIFILILLSSCQYFKDPISKFKTEDYNVLKKDEMLCFDLSEDDKIKAALLIKKKQGRSDKTIILPFNTNEIENDADILSASSNYNDISVFNFKGTVDNQTGVSAIKFSPAINDWPKDLLSEEELEDGVYFNISGLERKFVYKYSKFPQVIAKYTNANLDTIKQVAVRLPEKFKGLAFDNGSMYYPIPKIISKRVSLFESDKEPISMIKVNYMVPANKKQIALFEYLLKLVALLLAPLIDLIFIKPSTRFSPKTKRIIMWIVIVIESIMIATMIVLILLGSVDQDKIFDFVICLVGAAITYFLIYLKEGTEPEQPTT